MHRVFVGGLVSAFFALGLAASANASAIDLQRSGNVFHAAVCGEVQAGHARWSSRIVPNSKGEPFAARLAPIGGYAPADLRSAYKIKKKGKATTIVALVDAFGYDNAEADLGTYRSQFGLPA